MIELSIVIPTCNRAPLLARCLTSVRRSISCNYEAIVVNGASTDETSDVLAAAKDMMGDRLRVINEPQREGFVRAANKGFAAARGRCVTWVNDDARPLPGALDNAALQLLQAPANVGLIAMFHDFHGQRNIAYEADHGARRYKLLHVRGTLYANFGLGRLSTFRDLGFFDERYFLNAADPDFSLKVWHAGLEVVPAADSFIDHDEHDDDRRAQDGDRAQADNVKLFEKWDLPPKNLEQNDFDPQRPCTLRGLRPTTAVAA
ncbi:MAG TPA: glycosyltransferase [Tepidisphaeraceae bacterium]|nr:glycosyltransferase [Tepidisphaeraceae bacterium]